MKKLLYRLLPLTSSAAFALGLFVIGKTCRSFLYQPPVPMHLRDTD